MHRQPALRKRARQCTRARDFGLRAVSRPPVRPLCAAAAKQCEKTPPRGKCELTVLKKSLF